MDIRYPEKKVDEAWKQSIDEEKTRMEAAPRTTGPRDPKSPPAGKQSEPSAATAGGPVTSKPFMSLLQMLAMQAYLALGEMENPVTGTVEVNLPQAKAFIDLLTSLQEKTKDNLSKDEGDSLNTLVYELQMKFTERKAGHL